MQLPTIDNIFLDNQTILLRTDFDVPMVDGSIVDDRRIKDTLETIKFLLSKNCKIIILSHLGRPKGQVIPELSLKPIAKHVQKLLPDTSVIFSQTTQPLQPKQILLLENLRFDPREEANDETFAKEIASLGTVFINEAFAVSHRSHTSIVGIPKLLPHAAGFAFAKEITTLTNIKQSAEKPIVVILGGKKQDKLNFIPALASWADKVLIGGLLPRVVGKEGVTEGNVTYATLTADGKDITMESSDQFKEIIVGAKTIIWNGTMDLFEDRHNQAGTRIVATAIVEATAKRYAGGGDTTAAITKLNLLDKFDFISSGGGAMLEMLAHEKIVGMEALIA